ncbi:hypothetical protein M9458_025013, partial [Cirrhinus mrigala]
MVTIGELRTRLCFLQRGGVPDLAFPPANGERAPPLAGADWSNGDGEGLPKNEGFSFHRHLAASGAAKGMGWTSP